MPTQRPPDYPTTSDIGCALWLRHFATVLPNYASHYGLAEEEVVAVQLDSLKFTTWLIRRVHRTTQAIQQPSLVSSTPQEAAADEATNGQRLLEHAARLVRVIRAHHQYSLLDGVHLKLNLSPAHTCFDVLPAPLLRVARCQVQDKAVAVTLSWEDYPEAAVDLQVCRDGHTWEVPQAITADGYVDRCVQPSEAMQWRYRARYQRPDWPAGPWSQVVAVSFRPTATRLHCVSQVCLHESLPSLP